MNKIHIVVCIIGFCGKLYSMNTSEGQANVAYWEAYRKNLEIFMKVESRGSLDYNRNGSWVVFKGLMSCYRGKTALEVSPAGTLLLNGYRYKYDGKSYGEIINGKFLINNVEQRPISTFNPLLYLRQKCHLLFSHD